MGRFLEGQVCREILMTAQPRGLPTRTSESTVACDAKFLKCLPQ